jgi:predicted Zn-dependent protease
MTNSIKVLLCSLALSVAGCDTLGRWKSAGTSALLDFIPREVDKSIGEIAEKTQGGGGLNGQVPPQAREYLNQLAEPLLRQVSIPPLEMKLEVAQSAVPNAYAFPHGRIVVTSKLLQISKSPEEILAVLSHELAHVAQRHSMQQLLAQAGTSLAINMVFGDFGALTEVIGTGGQLLGLKFSRDHEREADALGADFLRKAKLPLGGVADFFQRMQEYEASKVDLSEGAQILSFLSTHPPTAERIEAARKLVSEPDAKTPVAQREAYQKLKTIFK